MHHLPKILLVSELTLGYSRNGKSVNPTLYNLFETYPAERIMQVAPAPILHSTPPTYPFDNRAIGIKSSYIPEINNRLGRLLNSVIQTINVQLTELLPLEKIKQIKQFAPELILLCPITVWGLVFGLRLIKQLKQPYLIYFMDNWMANNNTRWLTGNVHAVTQQLLSNATGWLMISAQLQADLADFFDLSPSRSIIVHNPVDLTNITPPTMTNKTDKTFQIAYAGSIQVMHYDALATVAEAIFELRHEGFDIELVLYTAPIYWDLYKEIWMRYEVKYGSLIPYDQLNRQLQQADTLLVATSFLPANAPVIRSSILTKLTDYMAAGKPILSCGPVYSACNGFVEQWNCGAVCATQNIAAIKSHLLELMNNQQQNHTYAVNGFRSLQQHFEKSAVSQKLYDFIQDIHDELSMSGAY